MWATEEAIIITSGLRTPVGDALTDVYALLIKM